MCVRVCECVYVRVSVCMYIRMCVLSVSVSVCVYHGE